MSSYPLFLISRHDKPEQIEMRIGVLMRLYLIDKDRLIAKAIEEHINAILAWPGYITDIEQRCLFRSLAMHWRCLAWIDGHVGETAPERGVLKVQSHKVVYE